MANQQPTRHASLLILILTFDVFGIIPLIVIGALVLALSIASILTRTRGRFTPTTS